MVKYRLKTSNISVWTWGGTSSLWGWWSTGTGCPGRLWSLLLWRYSRPAWTGSCVACCRWPCFGRGVGLDDPQRSLPTPTILWFCDGSFVSLPSHWSRHWWCLWWQTMEFIKLNEAVTAVNQSIFVAFSLCSCHSLSYRRFLFTFCDNCGLLFDHSVNLCNWDRGMCWYFS